MNAAALTTPTASPLPERQHLVLTLLAHGLTTSEIATRLERSPETVRTQVAHLRLELAARNRAHAVAVAAHAGFLSLTDVTPDRTRPRRLDLAPVQLRGLDADERTALIAFAHGWSLAELGAHLRRSRTATASLADRLLQRVWARNRAHAVALSYRYGVRLLACHVRRGEARA